MSEMCPKPNLPYSVGQTYNGLVRQSAGTGKNAVVILQTPNGSKPFVVILGKTPVDALKEGTQARVKILNFAISRKGNNYAWGELVAPSQ